MFECARVLIRRAAMEATSGFITVKEYVEEMANGATPSRKEESYWDRGTIPWLKTKEVNNNFIFETEELITENALEKTSVRLLPKDTVVMALYGSGTAGRLGLLQVPSTTNQACTAMICSNATRAFYLFLALKSRYRYIDSMTRGSVQQNLSKDIVGDISIPALDDSLLLDMGLDSIYSCMKNTARESIVLSKLRDALLPGLMSGKIDASAIELQ